MFEPQVSNPAKYCHCECRIDRGHQLVQSWQVAPGVIPPDAPRTGRELELFHIATAFLQNVSVNAADCDVVMEISHAPDKKAARMIVETPIDSEYYSARQNIQPQLKQHGFLLASTASTNGFIAVAVASTAALCPVMGSQYAA
jgi:hypothetical protein